MMKIYQVLTDVYWATHTVKICTSFDSAVNAVIKTTGANKEEAKIIKDFFADNGCTKCLLNSDLNRVNNFKKYQIREVNIFQLIKENLSEIAVCIAILIGALIVGIACFSTLTMTNECKICPDGHYKLVSTSTGYKTYGTKYTYECDICNDIITVGYILN